MFYLIPNAKMKVYSNKDFNSIFKWYYITHPLIPFLDPLLFHNTMNVKTQKFNYFFFSLKPFHFSLSFITFQASRIK